MNAEGFEPAPALPELWTVVRAAEALSVSEGLIYKLMESGELPYVHIGRCRRIKRDEVVRLLERSTVERA